MFFFRFSSSLFRPLGLLIVSVAASFGVPAIVHAASLSVEVPQTAFPPGGRMEASVYLDTEGEEINALEGTLIFSGDGVAALQDVRDGGSAVPLWVRRPTPSPDGSVAFAGVIPGGLSGERLLLFRAVIRAEKPGDAALSVDALRAFRNDGQGTALPIHVIPRTLQVAEGAPEPDIAASRDTEPPEPFTPILTRDPLLADGSYALVFLAQDKGSGIDHYDVFETPRTITREADVAWKPAASPYALADQSLGSFVYVRAVDREGNERIARMEPLHPRAWYADGDLLPVWALLIGFIVLLGYAVGSRVWKKAAPPWERPQ